MATRRTPSTRQPRSIRTTTTTTVSADQLAEQLASGLTISNAKGKQKASAISDEHLKLSAMRSVNAASQALSTVIQSGWKRSAVTLSSKHSSPLSGVTASAVSAAKHLRVLRGMCPNDIDVERAASSVLGKLVALEMYDDAVVALEALHPRICSLNNSTASTSRISTRLHLLSISLPLEHEHKEPILLTLTSSYLTYAICVLTYTCFSASRNARDGLPSIEAFADDLMTGTTLLTWIPTLSSLPIKQMDSVLTRAYTSLTKACSTCKTNPKAIFLIRMYAVTCLAHASAGTVESNTFWDQVSRFGVAFIKDHGLSEEEAMRTTLSAFSDLVGCFEKRAGRETFLSGKGFIGFCEYWMSFAKKAGDICILDRIGGLMHASSLGSPSSSGTRKPGLKGETQTSGNTEGRKKQEQGVDKATTALNGARICATLVQMTAIFEQNGPDVIKRAQDTTRVLQSTALMQLFEHEDNSDEETLRISEKVDRALERMRRAAIRVLESSMTGDENRQSVHTLLEEVAHILRQSLHAKPDSDGVTRYLDTLFVLARVRLDIIDPRTYVPAHEYLAQAAEMVESLQAGPSMDAPNFLRCVSGAFHNLAGTMYQAGKHGAAIGFLKDACTLGVKALRARGSTPVIVTEKAEEGWKQMEEQLYRRWELLGVCYSKIGDRQKSFEAFSECVKTFPYTKSGFIERTDNTVLGSLFDSSSTKQLGMIIDRLSYLGACELLLDADLVSLGSADFGDPRATGVVLERQVESLEGNRWKESVQKTVAKLLVDTLKVYASAMPIRRARVLLKCMDFTYLAGPEALSSVGTPKEMAEEVQQLLKREDFGRDAAFAPFCSQYLASAHLWLALHAHRQVDVDQSLLITRHTEEACRILKASVLGAPGGDQKSAKKSSPRRVAAVKKSALGPPVPRQRTTRATALKKNTIPQDPVTPKPRSRKALQPVSLNTVTPPRPTNVIKSPLIFDDLEKLLSLLELTARISGLLALVLSKVHILNIVRSLCEQQMGILSDAYIMGSVDLAHEYVKLGKSKRAASIFSQVLSSVRSGKVSDEACTSFFLRFAESLAMAEDVDHSSSIYCEALALSERFDFEEKGIPTIQRIHTRVKRLERAAIASHVFALIQYSKENVSASLDGMLQSLRLWNRAVDTLTRLNPPIIAPSSSTDDSNPFQMTSLKDALPSSEGPPKEIPVPTKTFSRRPFMNGLEWRVSGGLLSTLFALSQAYLVRGSAREAEYFAQQAQDLAESLNVPTMVSRALAKKGEIQLYQGKLEDSFRSLTKASELLKNSPGIEDVDIRRLRGIYNERTAQHMDAQELYEQTIQLIEELDQALKHIDGLAFGRKSVGGSPNSKTAGDIILPEILAAVLRQRIWLLRDNNADDYTVFLDRFMSLPHSSRTKAGENSLMAKLTLHAVYGRFRSDMFLSSLAESTIALPMGMSSKKELALLPPTQNILANLDDAEKLYWANLLLTARRGGVPEVRDTVVSLALVHALQTSLGKASRGGPSVAANLLDASAAITLRREMLESIQHKFPSQACDDLLWPLITPDGKPLTRLQAKVTPHLSFDEAINSDDDDSDISLREYWESVRARYQSQALDASSLTSSSMAGIPPSWTVVHINVTEDKSTLFITRQEGGDSHRDPLIFCVPLKGRRDNGSGEDEEEHLTFEDALEELQDIIKSSDDGTRAAVHIKPNDQEGRSAWWKERNGLNTRLRELLENIEFCWLGAFKTILSPRPNLTPELISDLRTQFERVFQGSLRIQDKKIKQRSSAHKKNASQSQSQVPSQVSFDDILIECFSTLSPKCRDEELEDLVYFILDLYQFHGVPVAIAEVDVVQVVVDLRAVLEDHAQKLVRRKSPQARSNPTTDHKDEHMFLVLDKNLQGFPWESIPILRGRSVSRIPSVDFLHDRISFAKWKRGSPGSGDKLEGAIIDPRKGYYILNPSGDLGRTEDRFKDWALDMEEIGWQGITGHPPSEQQFLNALRNQDLVVYFGHGGGEQYLRSHKIRHLPTCAATMLWGCSSGALKDMGDFDRVGTPYNYMLAGCPTLVANLWDVTDRDIDKFSQSVFDKLRLTCSGIRCRQRDNQISIVAAVAQSRDSCKLDFLTGAAPVVYGIPFFL